MSTEYLFATSNPGKLIEARTVFAKYKLKLLSPDEYLKEHAALEAPSISESGLSYEENALLKAQAFRDWTRLPVFADDAGLEVAALQGAPGIYSARFAGEHCEAQANIHKLLALLGDTQDRSACFKSVICLLPITGKALYCTGTLEGEISFEPRGKGGFGYDSVFLVKGFSETLAELKERGQFVETHRIQALEQLCQKLVQPK